MVAVARTDAHTRVTSGAGRVALHVLSIVELDHIQRFSGCIDSRPSLARNMTEYSSLSIRFQVLWNDI